MYDPDYSLSERLVYLEDKVAELEQKVADLEEQTEDLDPEELVRCKDCKHRQPVENCMFGECMYAASMVADDDYCSNGERKDGEEE